MGTSGDDAPFLSVVIPSFNGAGTIGACLDGLYGSGYKDFEAIVVDDGSTDGSTGIVSRYPCTLVRFEHNRGASAARNAGARAARGRVVFFMDSDCVVGPRTLALAAELHVRHPGAIVGGTYTPLSHDGGFFSDFQSLFIHHAETRRKEPDYVAAHAMLMDREMFLGSGGFDERFMPIIEDVEYSHRMRRAGVALVMEPALQVGHIFGFTLWRSMRNAWRKSLYWTRYSLGAGDLHRDSGTASIGLKASVLMWPVAAGGLALGAATGRGVFLAASAGACLINAGLNSGFLRFVAREGGAGFFLQAALYYAFLYPLAVGLGGLMGAMGRR